MEINKFMHGINNTYNRDTCYPALQNSWNQDNSALGHCAIVALMFFETYGGQIKRVNIINSNLTHYYNILNGEIFDITKNQFKNGEVYESEITKTKEDILSSEEFKLRYEVFSKRFNEYINKLDEIDKQVLKCKKCLNKVEKFSHHTTISYGKESKILVIGEAPANNGWRKSGRCWYKEDGTITGSGKVMTRLLKLIDYELNDISFVEAIKCYPPKRSDLNFCKKNCYPYLFQQILALNPRLILTLGDVATRSVLNDINYKNFNEVVGNLYKMRLSTIEYDVIPIYHPSPISPLSYKGNEVIFLSIRDLYQIK